MLDITPRKTSQDERHVFVTNVGYSASVPQDVLGRLDLKHGSMLILFAVKPVWSLTSLSMQERVVQAAQGDRFR